MDPRMRTRARGDAARERKGGRAALCSHNTGRRHVSFDETEGKIRPAFFPSRLYLHMPRRAVILSALSLMKAAPGKWLFSRRHRVSPPYILALSMGTENILHPERRGWLQGGSFVRSVVGIRGFFCSFFVFDSSNEFGVNGECFYRWIRLFDWGTRCRKRKKAAGSLAFGYNEEPR